MSILLPETFRREQPLADNTSVSSDFDKPRIPKLRHRLEDAAEALDVSLSHLRNRIAEGSLRVIYDGAGAFVLDHDLRKYASTNHPFSPAMRRKNRAPVAHPETETSPDAKDPQAGKSAFAKPDE